MVETRPHKHIFFPLFFCAFMRTSLPCWHLGSHLLPSSPTTVKYTLFGYCKATYSWHSLRGPCLLIHMAYSWLNLRCLLYVRSTPWLTGSSFLNGGVQRVCSCRHNKWAARLPLTALLQGKGEVEGISVGAARCLTVCGFLGHCKTATQQAGVVSRKWTKQPWECASWLPRLQQGDGARGGVMKAQPFSRTLCFYGARCRCRQLQVFNTAWPTLLIFTAATHKTPGRSWHFSIINH